MAKTATVNLTTGDITSVETPAYLLRDYLGGRGSARACSTTWSARMWIRSARITT